MFITTVIFSYQTPIYWNILPDNTSSPKVRYSVLTILYYLCDPVHLPVANTHHPSLSILNPNISLTSLIGLRASPSVPHGLPPQLCVILILPLMPNTYLRNCASLCHHLSHFPHCKSYFFLFAYLLLEIVLLWPYNVDCCLKCYIS